MTLRTPSRTRAALVALAAVLMLPTAAAAHGHLERSEPAAGARLTVAPTSLLLLFSEAPELAVTRVELFGPDGAPVALAPLRVSPESRWRTRACVICRTSTSASC